MRIDSTITLHSDELDRWQWKKLLQQLTFRDADGLEVSCYRIEDDGLGTSRVVIPRGASNMLPESLQIEQDGRSLPRMPKLGFHVELDGEGFSGQEDALRAMLREQQGLIVRQPGSGKTQIALAFIATANTPTLVVVHTHDLKQQWQEYAQRAIPSIKLGNLHEPGHLTIATVQTLKRYTLNGDNFWSQWGAIIIDETHHAAANSWEWVLNVSRAYYRFGFTATERRADGREPLVQFLVGPVIHKQRFESRVPVEIQPVPTDFSFRYRSEWDWNPMLNAIADDRPRNKLIAETAVKEMREGNSVLVLSRRIKHLQNVRDEIFALAGENGVVLLTGQLTKKLRKQIVEGFRDGTVKILLATQLADEGLDIPRLNRVLLTWPGKHDGRIIQQVGRALRESPDKTDALIYDFADTRVRVLANQFVKRRATYRMLGIKSRGGNNGTQARQAIRRLSSRLRV